MTPTGHFSAEVIFFQSASESFATTAVISAALASNCLASDSARALMACLPERE